MWTSILLANCMPSQFSRACRSADASPHAGGQRTRHADWRPHSGNHANAECFPNSPAVSGTPTLPGMTNSALLWRASDRSLGGGRDESGVLGEDAGGVARCGRLPAAQALADVGVGQRDIQAARRDIENE